MAHLVPEIVDADGHISRPPVAAKGYATTAVRLIDLLLAFRAHPEDAEPRGTECQNT